MKNAWKIVGGCGCLSMLAGAAMIAASIYAGVDALKQSQKRDDVARYVNTSDGRTGNLAANYVDFSFDYPKLWSIKTDDGTNFVTVERTVDGKTYENLSVGYFRPAATREENERAYNEVLAQIEGDFARQFRDFRKVSEGAATVGKYDGYEALYEGKVDVDGQPVDVFVRVAFLPTPDGTKGVSMMMIGTSLNPELEEANDLGRKGELPVVLESFAFAS